MSRSFDYYIQSILFLVLINLTSAHEENKNDTNVNHSPVSVRQFGGGLGSPLFFLIGLGIAFIIGIASFLIPLAGFLINSIQTLNANMAATLAATQATAANTATGGIAGTGGVAGGNPGVGGGAGGGAAGGGAAGGGVGGGRRKRNAHYQQWSDRFITALETLDIALKKTYTS
ncbi:uncharacterized protein LOC143235754 [Tachypleus tridentatus]|uniref:uncharacterized protein LOC143235754 n=1 Tax=Tachypleus tridentatus TaxID=6853 RepID=UPI003FD1EA0C